MIKKSQEDYFIKIAFNLFTLRTEKNLTQEKLSFDSGVERSKISRIENAKEDFIYSTIINLAETMHSDPNKITDQAVVVPNEFRDKIKKETK